MNSGQLRKSADWDVAVYVTMMVSAGIFFLDITIGYQIPLLILYFVSNLTWYFAGAENYLDIK